MSTYHPVINTQADLQEVWQHLMGPFGYHRHSVWWLLIEADGQPIPQLTELEDATEPPDPEQRAAMAGFLADLVGSLEMTGPRLAFLISRPGRDAPRPEDAAWAAALYDVARLAGLACEVVHLANDSGVVPLPLDALATP